MPITYLQPSPSNGVKKQAHNKLKSLHFVPAMDLARGLLLSFLAVLLLTVAGCGAGGYAGGGIEAMSASALTLDAGQSYEFTTMVSGTPTVTYSLTCSASSGCGSLSNTTGTTVVYTAPAGITAQMAVTLTAAITGTPSASRVAITVNPDPTLVGIPPGGTIGTLYTANLNPTGGTAPLTMSITSGSLPPGLMFNAATGAITGTPTFIGTYPFTVQITDSSAVPYVLPTQESIVISSMPGTVINVAGNPPAGIVNDSYSTTFAGTGGTGPYTFTQLSGSLPPGLTLSSSGVLSGVPTTPGISVFTIQAEDSVGDTGTGVFSITVTSQSLSLTVSSLPNGTVQVPYSAPIGVTGGTAPYSCTITSNNLPAGLTLTGCLVSGTPTTAGSVVLTVVATDSSNPKLTTTGPVSLTINPAGSLTLTSPPSGTANTPYTGNIGVSGGAGPYTCTLSPSTPLPAGLTISNCTISGTPTTPGTTTLTVTATDSTTPTNLTTTGPVTLVIAPGALTLTLATLPDGTINVPYSHTIGVSGGTAPYSCTIVTGALPSGLELSGCLVSGTPTASGTFPLTVKATDNSNPQETVTGPVSLTINPASLSLSLSTLPNGTINVAYSQTIGVTGGKAPYSCTISPTTPLPTGLTLTSAGCLVSGKPTVAETVHLAVTATDSNTPQGSTSGTVALTINPAAASLVLGTLPGGTVGTPYTGTIGVTGGTSPYTCLLSPSTPLPAGLSISNCTITGNPTTAATTSLTVTATDSSSPTHLTVTGPVSLVISAATSTLTITSPPPATVGVPYTGPIGITGGTAPYSCTESGTMPDGLTLTSAGCVITGTPTTPGSTTITVTATSSGGSPTGSGPITIVVNALTPLAFTGSLPNAIQNVAYAQTLTASGGVPPYTYALTSGTLPTGISLSTNSQTPAGAVFSGTPTNVGLSNFTVTVTDSEATPQSVALPLSLLVQYPTGPNDSYLMGPYAYLFQGYDNTLLGLLSYQTATVGSFTADGTGGINSGEMDANHQGSVSSSNTINTANFVGTYTIGADDRGTLMIITLNSDGTARATNTYDIAVQAPIAPVTNSVEGNMIEYDAGTITAGTEGSGTFLAQTATALAAGLNGSYAFGLSGDSPCLPACSVNLTASPAGTVGVLTGNGESADGGSLISGASDTNIGTTNTSNSQLSGTYTTADTNGRLALQMDTDNMTNGLYPTDFAVYMIDANRAYIISTDLHSQYILLAGSAQLQTPAITSGNTAIDGNFIGYENSTPNIGVLGIAPQSLLSLSTATLFQGTSTTTANTCDIQNVTTSGATALIGTVSGIVGAATGVTDLLGNYQTTGDTSCAVNANGRGVLYYPAPPPSLLSLLTTLLNPVLGPVLALTDGIIGTNDANDLDAIVAALGVPPAPRVFYLSSPNTGYFLETGYAAVGKLEAQTGGPFTIANTFTPTPPATSQNYVFGSTPAASAVSLNTSGIVTTFGGGNAQIKEDSVTVSAGDLNILTLGTSTPTTYGPINPTTGIFPLGPYTVYTINPNRFVLINPSLTSPSVSVLY